MVLVVMVLVVMVLVVELLPLSLSSFCRVCRISWWPSMVQVREADRNPSKRRLENCSCNAPRGL